MLTLVVQAVLLVIVGVGLFISEIGSQYWTQTLSESSLTDVAYLIMIAVFAAIRIAEVKIRGKND
ncbi:MAG: hypothetical protein ACXACW_16460 [Candidatus Hodarchaeales archaeon]|jgi:hypothetical protein